MPTRHCATITTPNFINPPGNSHIMKFPKKTNRFCPHCNKVTEQKIKIVSSGTKRGALKRGGIARAKLRGKGRGIGNKGKWGSKPAVSKFKMKTKTTKKAKILYTCSVCNKGKDRKAGIRASKVLQE
jgi:ribosomal protein L44E